MKYYNSITNLPLRIYEKITKDGDLKHLKIDGGSNQELLEAWETINKEFFEEFGVADSEQIMMLAKIAKMKYLIDYFLNGNKFAKTLASIEEEKIVMYSGNKGGGASFLKLCVNVSKALEMRIDYGTVTVGEFFHYAKLAEEINKQSKH